jgi:hypothetical protein
MGMEAIKSELLSSLFWQGIEVEHCTGKLKMISESITLEGGEFKWPTRTVLIMGATVKWNRAKAYPKARTHTVVIDAPMLHRWLQTNANVDTPVASKISRRMASLESRLGHHAERR